MSREILVLDQQTIDKIAAGEVIERPASIVKELVENAIDAGANAVTIEIKEGGISLIRITDNGSGIVKEQVPTAFLRHATSKIRSAEDLFDVTSLGFRGEALSSIAAISQVELITKTADDLTGTRYLIEGGKEKSIEEIGAPSGTTFLVRNIFYNTPARKKFLKTAQTEAGYINAVVEHMALSHPEVSFKFIVNQQTKLHTSGNHNLKDIIYHVFGREIAANVIEVNGESDSVQIHGFIGKPLISRGNRNYENYFVNGRYIRSKVISKAIEDAYHTFMMKHQYPFTVLHLTIDGDLLDVNVHPAKLELRFSENEKMYQFIYDAVRAALTHREIIPQATIGKEEKPEKKEQGKKVSIPEPFETARRTLANQNGSMMPGERTHEYQGRLPENTGRAFSGNDLAASNNGKMSASGNERIENQIISERSFLGNQSSIVQENIAYGKKGETSKNANALTPGEEQQKFQLNENQITEHQITENQMAAGEKKTTLQHSVDQAALTAAQTPKKDLQQMELFDDRLLSRENVKEHKIIGQLFETYWMVEFRDQLYIIDQHAAHEKVMYERFMKALKTHEFTSQYLNPPMIMTLNMSEEELLKKYVDRFTAMGFEIEEFGGKEYALRAVPDNLFDLATEDMFIEMLDSLAGQAETVNTEMIDDKIASMSCKAAVKGNTKLSLPEIHALIDELLALENPYNCPHGRPTIISMSKYELERKFKRIV